MGMFNFQGENFTMDGNPIRIISGAIHYFRVVPEYWRDRLLKLKACGFNTVETYVAWNLHEPKQGEFNFAGIADLEKFIEIAGEVGLMVIVRPSPYICAEWEFGGLPAWLLADSDMRLRCFHQPFLDKVDAYYDVLLPKLEPLLCTNGGPIIAMQIENEYGSYGNDKKYLNYLKDSMQKRGIDVLLFTSDGPLDYMLQGGMVEGVLATVNFGSSPDESFEKLREYQPDKPLMCMEFWNGWFDHWGEEHHTRDAGDVAQVLDEMLKANASVNFYMFHGGTNFGFYNGANNPEYAPTITSYDYDVLLDEAGDPTPKFHAVRKVIENYVELGELVLPDPIKKKSYGQVHMTEQIGLLDHLDAFSTPSQHTCPEPMEKLGQDYGFIMYTTHISGPRIKGSLFVQDVHDRAMIFLDDKFIGIIERDHKEMLSVELEIPHQGAKLSILVENMGRTNYGPLLKDYKGITEGARFANQFLYDWTIHTLPLDSVSSIPFAVKTAVDKDKDEAKANKANVPTFFKGTLEIDELADTFLNMAGWTKGVVYINGFNLGRYWERGPQKTLYVPAPLLKQGQNEIVVFELHGCSEPCVTFVDKASLQ
ncbi:glycoside hydrolase family 35 protein [Paenibacillus eucommiae]|uniref:Beta-galactosidase n=1 Tax=Paenibacillus eucommiae TaxID=1355755 RepID=A0ABS4IME6_9BACL|nr:beta-galactosidase family protein [Paenibacillus eucommiae]MBP1988746.1 beta-galactosidase [Paenibacillus eucommiae]